MEEFRRRPEAGEMAWRLLALPDLGTKMYALNLLEDQVRERVVEMPAEELSAFLGSLWSSALQQASERVVRARLAQVTAQCMLRVWPQRWPQAFDLLLGALTSDATRETSKTIHLWG